MIEWLKIHGLRMIIIIGIGIIIYIMSEAIIPRFVRKTITTRMGGKSGFEIEKRTRTLSRVIRSTITILIAVVVLFTILAELEVNIGPALASLGVLGIAVGFGAQSLVKDLVNGLFILMENQYGIGDVVKIKDISGLVEEVNLRRTILRDLDGVVHYIPNGEVVIASNYSKEFSRVNMNITVSYNEDLDRVFKVINKVCAQLAGEEKWLGKIVKKPEVLRVDALGESGIDIKILGDTTPLKQWEVMGELRKRIKKEFDKQGIEIPYPHVKVYFANRPDKQP